MYDDATGSFLLHPDKQKIQLSEVRSISAKDVGGFVVVEGNDVNYYMWGEPSGALRIDSKSITGLDDLISLSMKPKEDEYATLTAGGQLDYWVFNAATGSMTKNGVLSRSGITLNLQYLSPAEYRSVAVPTAINYDTVRISAITDEPDDTVVTFYVSSDGGTSWMEASNGEWTTVPAGNSFTVRAVLSSSDPEKTPKILSLKLEASVLEVKDLKVLAVAASYQNQVLPSSDFPVRVRSGAMIQFEIHSSGFAESAWASFPWGECLNMVPLYMSVEERETNFWRGSCIVPDNAVEGSLLELTVTVDKGGVRRTLIESEFVWVQGNVLDIVTLIMTR